MPKNFAIFDIDGTLIRWQLYHAIANTLAKDGYFTPEAAKAIRESRMAWKRRESSDSFKEYEKQLISAVDEMLKTLKVEQFDQAVNQVFEEYKDQAYTYTRDLIKELKGKGYLLLAVSGSQIEIVKKIVDYYGFDDCAATIHGKKNGRFTGMKNVIASDKLKALTVLVTKHGAVWEGSIGVGDTYSDIPILEAVDEAIAINPEKQLYAHARAKGWKIVIERKNVVYELEAKDGKYLLV